MPSGRPVIGLDSRAEQDFLFGTVARSCETGDTEVTALTSHPAVRDSWRPGITFKSASSITSSDGLRRAQLGAVHAVLAYWSTGNKEPATVVLPTGTGKTETMLALLVEARIERLLVVVPTDALRGQLAGKFEQLGLLGTLGVLPPGALKPAVGRLTGGCRSRDEMEEFLAATQVIIATPNSIAASEPASKDLLLQHCSALFFDEAHHVRARTWTSIRDAFKGKPILQFTATPFREDGKHLQGKFVYVFPLREAQADGVFSRIEYESIFDLVEPDRAIATRAIEVLRADREAGLDHIVMARCSTHASAEAVHALYRDLAPDLGPVVLHSGMTERRRGAALREVESRRSRIVVCVDMLGEGFDLPNLKIAALHDPRQSLGPTLQFTGRFARVAAGTGDAKVLAGRSEKLFDRRLSRLYTEDADWNLVIAELSSNAATAQEEVTEFEEGFGSAETRVATRSIAPKMSTVVFETTCEDWSPESVLEVVHVDDVLTLPLPINRVANVLWFVRRTRGTVPWVEGPGVEDVVHDLFVLHWDREANLLFINHSANEGVNSDLAHAVAGDDARLVSGESVFRAMGELTRPVPTNVGVLDIYSRARRFSMYVGIDVTDGFEAAEEATKVQTNVFATGFRDGNRVSVGVSLKGRIWSYLIARNMLDWVAWCQETGRRLQDESIDVAAIKRNFIRPEILTSWPEGQPPLAAEWPTELLLSPPQSLQARIGKEQVPFQEIALDVQHELTDEGYVRLKISIEGSSATYDLVVDADGMRAVAVGPEAEFTTTQRTTVGSKFLTENGVIVLLGGDGVVSPPGVLFRPNRRVEAFSRDRLTATGWEGVARNRESIGISRDLNTVQGHSLALLMLEDWDVIVNDDGKGEVADLVALRRTDDDELLIKLVHCKFAHGGTVGARLADIYELCGQAQKSAVWRRHPVEMLQRLVTRERNRLKNAKPSGLEKGTSSDLVRLIGEAQSLAANLEVVLAQPGLSRSRASTGQLEVLGATSTYIRETSNGRLSILCSD